VIELSEVRFSEIKFGEIGFGEIKFGEIRFGEIGFGENGFGEIGFGENGFGEIGFGEMRWNRLLSDNNFSFKMLDGWGYFVPTQPGITGIVCIVAYSTGSGRISKTWTSLA